MHYAEKVINEMIRVCQDNGTILIGDVNDIKKKDIYLSVRNNENISRNHIIKELPPPHMFYYKRFFRRIADENGLGIKIIDEVDLDIPFYSQSLYRFTVVLKKMYANY